MVGSLDFWGAARAWENAWRARTGARRSPAPRHSGAARLQRSRRAPHSSPCRSGVSTSMRRRCGCTARSAMVLTSANAISASARRFRSSSRVMLAKLSPTILSVSWRLRTRSTMLANLDRSADQVGPAPRRRVSSIRARSGSRSGCPLPSLELKHAVGRDRGMGKAMRFGGLPASALSSGTDSQSAITSNIEIRMSAPLPCATARSAPPGWRHARWRRWRYRRRKRRRAKALPGRR